MAQRMSRISPLAGPAGAALVVLFALLLPAVAAAASLPLEVEVQASDLSPAQQEALDQFLNGVDCPCGCNKGSLANCIAKDKSCSISRRFARQAIAELRTGGKIVAARNGVAAYKRQRQQRPKRARLDPNKQYDVEVGEAPVLGPADAPVTVIAYLDYQCPFCRRAWPTLERLQKSILNHWELRQKF